MRISTATILSAAVLALASCGGKGDDKLGEQAQEAMENRADVLDAAADNMSGASKDIVKARADALRDAGDDKEKAIDDSDVDASKLTPAQKNAVINGM